MCLSLRISATSGQIPSRSRRFRLMLLNINIEGPGDALLGDASLDRLEDHPVLLDHREAIDALVIGEGLVVS